MRALSKVASLSLDWHKLGNGSAAAVVPRCRRADFDSDLIGERALRQFGLWEALRYQSSPRRPPNRINARMIRCGLPNFVIGTVSVGGSSGISNAMCGLLKGATLSLLIGTIPVMG